ncbi:unnamed protein product [Clavelina lepadiformis]|uniref:TLC domain-containing protein n=1 Tax=Clavelina lepadiformis TaxID=159417 RepID=A0ABP0GA28_CLALP
MGRLTSVTLQVGSWTLYHLFVTSFIAPLLCKLTLTHFDDYNEERKKETQLRAASISFLVQTFGVITIVVKNSDNMRKSDLVFSNIDQWILITVISYCFSDIIMQLIWKMKRKPWQYLHHIYAIGIGGFVILINETYLSSASFKFTTELFIPILELLLLHDLTIKDNEIFRSWALIFFLCYYTFQIFFTLIYYYGILVRDRNPITRKLDKDSTLNYVGGGLVIEAINLYSFITICYIYWQNRSQNDETDSEDNDESDKSDESEWL